MTPIRREHTSLVLAALVAASFAVVAALAYAGASPRLIVLVAALAHVPYAGLLVAPVPFETRRAVCISVGLAVLAGLPLVLADTPLSEDAYRYLWDGRVLRSGISPYAYAPDDPALVALRDAAHRRINHPGIATIYPPIAQLLFAIGSFGGLTGIKAIALLAHVATIPVVARLAGRRGARAALLLGLHPLALLEAGLGGHVDAVAALFVASSVVLVARPLHASALAALAVGTKLVGLLLAPLLFVRDRRAGSLLVAVAALVTVPLVGAGRSGEAGLAHYARRWQGNAGLYVLAERGVASGLEAAFGVAPRRIRIPALDPMPAFLEGTAFDPRTILVGDKKEPSDRTTLHVGSVAPLLARLLVGGAWLAFAAWIVRRGMRPCLAARHLVLAALLLSPQVHPWYLLVLLPLEIGAGRVAGLVFGVTVLLAYEPLEGWQHARVWDASPLALLVEYGVVAFALGFEELSVRARDRARAASSAVPPPESLPVPLRAADR